MRGIRLFVFGGVAEMDEEPTRPLAEFMMAIAGPIASVFIAIGAYGVYMLGIRSGWTTPITVHVALFGLDQRRARPV